MKKFILFFVLSLLFVCFAVFLAKTYFLQKSYYESKKDTETPVETKEVEVLDKPSSYSVYTNEDYDKAISENRVVVLFFTSNWCKDCISQNDLNNKVFMNLDIKGVVGLYLHLLDSETTIETDSIAKKFDVSKENTLIILDKLGAVVFRQIGNIGEESLKAKIQEVVNK